MNAVFLLTYNSLKYENPLIFNVEYLVTYSDVNSYAPTLLKPVEYKPQQPILL